MASIILSTLTAATTVFFLSIAFLPSLALADVTVDHGPYESEYRILGAPSTNFPTSRSRCQSEGPGWDIGTIPTEAASDAVQGLSPSERFWVGVNEEAAVGTWAFVAGRLQNLTYSTGATCESRVYDPFGVTSTTFDYCNWHSSEPSGNEGCVAAGTDAVFNDIPCGTAINFALCERSPCKIGADCHPNNTDSVSSGYFPDCTCTCKAGFTGDQCVTDSSATFQYTGACVLFALATLVGCMM